MPLEEYRRKRDFGKTPEPAPAAVTGTTGRFVIQRHRATRLHYDFRLEIEGVLVSWAVPKGLTLDSSIRRMAVHVEDHPIEYFDFEGVIPSKQYGAGDVIVWDWGTWEPEAPTLDPRRAIEDGELKFVLHGEKVNGRFTIVRTSGRRRKGDDPSARAFEDDEGDQWLLIKKRDEFYVAGWDAEDHPQSVKTGRTNDDVKADRDALWNGQAPAAAAEIDLTGAVTAKMPPYIEPMLATLASKPFSDPDWLYEIKWDGFRVQAVVNEGKVKTWTRGLKDAETYFPRLLSPPSWIDAKQAIVDGEVVALDEDGRPDFSLLQTKLGQKGVGGLVYQPFDLLYLDGRLAARCPARGSQATAPERAQGPPAGALRVAYRRRRRGVLRGGGGQPPRGHDRQAPTEPVRAGQAIQGLAEAEGPARAGAGHRRLDAGRGQRPGSRRAGRGLLRRRQAEVRRQGRVGLHRPRSARSCSRSSSRSRSTTRRTTNRRRRTTRVDGAAISGR